MNVAIALLISILLMLFQPNRNVAQESDAPYQAKFRPAIHQHISPKTDFNETVETLRDFLQLYSRWHVNSIHVLKLKVDPENARSEEALYGYWSEKRAILLLDHFKHSQKFDDYYWLSWHAVINLRTDLVPTREDIGGSSYLVDKPWADYIVRSCLKQGQKLVLVKTERK